MSNTNNNQNNNFDNQVINEVIVMQGCQMCALTYNADVKLTKAQVALVGGKASKIVSGQFQINYSYENAVNNRATKESGQTTDFKAQTLPWGKWYAVNKLIKHNGEIYLRFYQLKDGKVNTQYFVNGQPATSEQKQILFDIAQTANAKKTATQTAAGLTDNQVKPRAVKIAQITSASINGKTFHRENEPTPTKIAL